jgi:hypothetical protein
MRQIDFTFDRFMQFLKLVQNYSRSGQCWQWQGLKTENGYGSFSLRHKNYAAHRISYTALIGVIPDGLTLDHLCRNRSCVNPFHLEPVTIGENVRRGNAGIHNSLKTHCKHGHEFISENTGKASSGGRFCITCNAQCRV